MERRRGGRFGGLKVKFVSGGARFMSRKFRETKPGSLEIFPRNRSKSKALKQARGLVMRDRRRAINKTSGGKWRDRALNGRWMNTEVNKGLYVVA